MSLSNEKMIDANQLASCVTNKHLGLILMPTEQCNFRCTYCYEDFSLGKMHREVIAGVKALIKNRLPELQSISIEWFGGEPLSAKNVIYDIGSFIMNQLSQYPTIRYRSGMTTNAYNLNLNTLKKLLALKINSFQISLDGTKEYHDKTRIRINGGGSFDLIWKNLLDMKSSKYDFKITLRLHVTPENYQIMETLINDINATFGKDNRFNTFIKAIENLGGANGGSFKTLIGKEKRDVVKRLQDLSLKKEKTLPIGNPSKPYICYAAKPNNFVIRSDGRISKCTVAFNDERNTLGKIHSNGTISVDADKLNLWARGLKDFDLKKLHCPLNELPRLNNIKKIPISIAK